MTSTLRRVIAAVLDAVGPIVQALSGEHRPSRLVRRIVFRDKPQSIKHATPVRHEGATERFGRELRALRDVEVSPELVSDIETELRWGLIWYDFERTMQAEIDKVFAPYLPVAECRDFDELREQMGLHDLASA